MGKIKVELNRPGVRAMLKSAEAAAACTAKAQQIALSAGEGFAVESRSYPERSGAAVVAETPEATRKAMKDNYLLKKLGSATDN